MKTLNRQKVFPKNFTKLFSSKYLKKEDAMLSATVPQIANHCQIPCCIIKFCYSWVNKCDVTRLRHKYQWYVEILVTSTIIPYLSISYPRMGPPTILGHHRRGPRPPPSKSGATTRACQDSNSTHLILSHEHFLLAMC